MKNGCMRLVLFLGIILVSSLSFAGDSFSVGCDPISRYAKSLVDETRWFVILSGEDSGHGSIKGIIRERYREDLQNGKIKRVYELTYHCHCQSMDGVIYIIDGQYRIIRIQGRAYACPRIENCQESSYQE